MHKLHEMLEKIEEKMCEELNHGIDNVDTEEFGKVADLYKDLMESKKLYLEACYYKHVVEAMEEMDPEDETAQDYLDFAMKRYYGGRRRDSRGRFISKTYKRGYEAPEYYMTPEMMHEHGPEYYRDMDRAHGRMYYTEPSGNINNSSSGTMRNYGGERDMREGRSGQMRKAYMESKEMHRANTPEDKQKKMADLESYMKTLAEDVTEMISGATPEEKNLLKGKMQTLMQKIQ